MDELAAPLERAGVVDSAVGDDAHTRTRPWRLREAMTGDVHKLDVGVPLTGLTRFLDELPICAEHGSAWPRRTGSRPREAQATSRRCAPSRRRWLHAA